MCYRDMKRGCARDSCRNATGFTSRLHCPCPASLIQLRIRGCARRIDARPGASANTGYSTSEGYRCWARYNFVPSALIA